MRLQYNQVENFDHESEAAATSLKQSMWSDFICYIEHLTKKNVKLLKNVTLTLPHG